MLIMIGSRRFPALPELAVLAVLSLALGGCQSSGFGDITGSTPAAMPQDPAALRVYAEELGQKYDRRPDDKATAMAYARVLKRLTQYAQATAVLQRLAVKNPHDFEVLAAYGKELADSGRLQEAAEVLERAHTPERPNWS